MNKSKVILQVLVFCFVTVFGINAQQILFIKDFGYVLEYQDSLGEGHILISPQDSCPVLRNVDLELNSSNNSQILKIEELPRFLKDSIVECVSQFFYLSTDEEHCIKSEIDQAAYILFCQISGANPTSISTCLRDVKIPYFFILIRPDFIYELINYWKNEEQFGEEFKKYIETMFELSYNNQKKIIMEFYIQNIIMPISSY
jgi:hypothetical protein